MDGGNRKERPPNPRATANVLKILTFSWVSDIFKTGRKKDLEANDLYTELDDYKSSILGDELEKRWITELANVKETNRKPSLLRVLFRMFGKKIMFCGLIQVFVEIIIRMSQPILIGGLLAYFNADKSSTVNIKHAYVYAFALVSTILINMVFFHYSHSELLNCGMKIRVACCSLIFKKALRLSRTSHDETSVGQIINLLSNDVNRFDTVIAYMNFLWIGPLGTIVATCFLWQQIGPSSLIGTAALLVFIPLQGWLGKKTSEYRTKIAPKTDERVKLMNEIISGIQVIKMYTWEKSFARLVQHSRKLEIDQIRSATHIKVTLLSFIIFHTRFAIFSSILVYVLLGNYITIQKVFIIIAYYNILLTTMAVFFPQAIGLVAEALVSIKRIQSFMMSDEIDRQKSAVTKTENTDAAKISTVDYELDTIDGGDNRDRIERPTNLSDIIAISNASAKWDQGQTENSLNNINLTVSSGQLIEIIGPVGAGKSSLVQAILRELPLSEGNVSVRGTVSYASQEPWLFNGSVQQNIIFNSPMHAQRYEQVIQVCALKTDFKQFPHGDGTIVGERGASLSGGQRARINLARAIYKEADIYLLDDPLSAVDTRVGNHIFQKCIEEYLGGKTRVLITHQKQYLANADRIVMMKSANVVADGNYRELQTSSGLDVNALLASPEENEVDSDDDGEYCVINAECNTASERIRRDSVESVSTSVGENDALVPQTENAETLALGNVSRDVYFSYLRAGKNVCQISFLSLASIFTYVLSFGGDYWISYWVNREESVFQNASAPADNFTLAADGALSFTSLSWWSDSREACITVYVVLTSAMIVFVFIRNASFVTFFTRISVNLHNDMFNAITRATMQFFNSNPSGRILNRFTKDMGAIDEVLQIPFMFFIHILFSLLGPLCIVGVVNVYLLIPSFVIALCCYQTIVYHLPTCRSIKRLEGITRSFVFAHLNASFQGLTTVRAFGAEDILSTEFDRHQDLHSSAWHLFIYSNAAFGFTLDIICLTYIIILLLSFLVLYNDTYGGHVGLIITQALNITGLLQWGVKQFAELENQMTSVERVLEYTNVSQEAALESSSDKKPPNGWPNAGQIVFQNVYLRYDPDAPYVLKNVNIKIQPSEKVGVVGRTGAGKSSLLEALYRLALNEGKIIIDNVEIHELGLHDLRSKLSIIPQEPVLFSGTMRSNLDPFGEYPDHVLWNALDEVELKKTVEDLQRGLDSEMSEGGSNFSVGQRQLVCLARALVRNNKFLMLDEATANVDTRTDALIQSTIRNKFRACTVLTIAHRLDTVMDSDKILVMDAGTMVEFDHPHNLLKNKEGFLYKMVQQTGQVTADSLRGVAAESYNRTMSGPSELSGKSSTADDDDAQDDSNNKKA